MAQNPWTQQQIIDDAHLGSRLEAAKIAAENGTDEPLVCGKCSGPAHYKQTIGTEKCWSCGAIRIGYVKVDGEFVRLADGSWASRWS